MYRLSWDVNIYIIFHKYCDNKYSKITLIEDVEGVKIGGYILLNWDSKYGR